MCESRTEWVTPPVTECNDENSRGLSKTCYPSCKGPTLPLCVPPEEHPLLSDTETQKLCSHVSNCSSQASCRRGDACDKSRSLLRSHDDYKEQDYYLERSWRKHPNSPPRAIVTPLIGGLVHSKTRAVDTSEHSENLPSYNSSSHGLICNTCQCHSNALTTICDLKSNVQTRSTTDGWKNLLEAKDKMLAQKNHLIERQKQSIANLQQQLRDAMRAELDCKAGSSWIKIDKLHASISCMKIRESEESKDKELQTGTAVLLEKSREECRSLNQKLVALQQENVTLAKECQKLQKLLFEGEVHSRQELQAMRERHKQRFVEATAELRLRHRAMAKRVRALEVQLLKNSDIVSALNSELQVSHGTIGDLKLSMKELVLQNQHLVEENVSLQESTTKALDVKTSNDAAEHQTQQLIVELAYCVEDLKSLISLCLSLLEGCDLSTSQMLGAANHLSLDEATASEHELDVEFSVRNKLAEVKHLTATVAKLREVVSDQFATRVSNACHVQ